MVLTLKLQYLVHGFPHGFPLQLIPEIQPRGYPQVDQRCGDESPWPLRRVVGGHVKGEVFRRGFGMELFHR